MCGLVYFNSTSGNPVNRKVLRAYKKQRNRGTQGFGFYIPSTNRLVHNPAEDRIKSLLTMPQNLASEVMFHHRMPTSTANVRNACHPFSTKAYFGSTDFVMIHNGYLFNEHELKANHKALGIDYVSVQPDGRFNDSEALLWDLALTLTGKQTAPKATGAIAFVMIERRNGKPYALHFGRNSSPLRLMLGPDGQTPISLTSEGYGRSIDAQTLYTYVYELGTLTKKPFAMSDGWYETNSKGYGLGRTGGVATWRDVVPVGHGTYANVPSTGHASSHYGTDMVMTHASDFFVEEACDYGRAINRAHRKRKLAEDAFKFVEREAEDLLGDALTRNLDEQMALVAEMGHYQAVAGTLMDWYEQDPVMGKKPLALPDVANKSKKVEV